MTFIQVSWTQRHRNKDNTHNRNASTAELSGVVVVGDAIVNQRQATAHHLLDDLADVVVEQRGAFVQLDEGPHPLVGVFLLALADEHKGRGYSRHAKNRD